MMKATKYTVTFTVEVLSTDVVGGIVSQALSQYAEEYKSGRLTADDGDTVYWETKSKEIEF